MTAIQETTLSLRPSLYIVINTFVQVTPHDIGQCGGACRRYAKKGVAMGTCVWEGPRRKVSASEERLHSWNWQGNQFVLRHYSSQKGIPSLECFANHNNTYENICLFLKFR